MKRAMMAALGLLAMAPVAQAADLPSPPWKAPAFSAVPGNFSGLTVGIIGAGAWASGPTSGAFGGIQVGYNWQNGPWVVGVNTDILLGSQKHSTGVNMAGVSFDFTDRANYLGSVTAKLGVTPASQWLFYGEIGGAYSTVYHKIGLSPIAGTVSAKSNKVGLTAGGGVVYALTPNLQLEAKYNAIWFSGDSPTYVYGPVSFVVSYPKVTEHVAKVGINYRFDNTAWRF